MSQKKYFTYIRVSTQRQGQHGTSLAEQQAAIERFAQSWKLPIIKRFEERETAAKQGRPVFLDMLGQLKTGGADGVIIHKIDRSARNLKDWADLGSLIDNGVEVHFASESLDLNSRGGRLSADIQAVVASDYIRNLSEEARKGLYGRLKQGIYPFQAPIGYNDRGSAKPKTIDPVKGPLVRKAFELYATGRWTLRKLPDELHKEGLRSRTGNRITVNGLFTILHNPFYTGVIRIQKTGELFAGIHEPLVSKRLFDLVQDVFAGKSVPKFTSHNFAFRRMIRCAKCGNFLIGELQKRWVYYRCQKRGCTRPCLKEETVYESLAEQLERIKLTTHELEYYRRESARLFDDLENESDQIRAELAIREKKIKDRLNRLIDSYMDGIITQGEYVGRKADLISEEQEIKEKMSSLGKNWANMPTKFEQFLELANSAYLSLNSAPADLKREMLAAVTSNMTANGKSVSIKLKTPFHLLTERPAVRSGRAHPNKDRTLARYLSGLFRVFVKSGANTTGDAVA